MRKEEFFEVLGELDDELVKETPAKRKVRWKIWGAAAACLCLVLAGGLIWRQAVPSYEESPQITVSEDGVTIPQMRVSLPTAGANTDMIAFFIYQGRCYRQYEWIYDDADIVGEYLGTATGVIDEWTPEEDYKEFSGSVAGGFYAVKGYDPAFMLCMKYPDGEISTYICDTGITMKYGSELYEDRLHLSGNFTAVQYESRASWYYSRGERYQMDGIHDIVLDFIAGMDSAQFVPYHAVPLDEGQTHLSETELYHLYFMMENGTTVHLRLHENGYVRFDGLLTVCVQVPEEDYGALLDLLDNRAGSAVFAAD